MADANFSTLEAVNPGFEPLRKEKPLPVESGKQVISEDAGKQVVVPYSDIEVTAQQQSTQHFPVDKNYLEPPVVENGKPRRRRKFLWIGGAVLLAVILAAVLGGVLGSKPSAKSSSRASTSTANATSSSNNTITPHKIAAIAYESNSINNTRVYYLADDGALTEAASSASNTTWGFTKIGYPEKNDSVLAAAVSRPNFPLVRFHLKTERIF